jgi:NADH:ubiquinone oxidoreductase subunit D
VLPHLARGRLIADLIVSIAMIDPVLGGIDR